jgi:uncharacterized SAM-binding protein YcdF (DUF218 family)
MDRRRWTQVVLGVAALLVVYYLVSLIQVVAAARSDDADNVGSVDAIVVLGAAQYDGRPSPQLAARLDHVVDLWLEMGADLGSEGLATYVMVTGGKLPGDRFTEAEASRRYLVEHGVPAEVILSEDSGSTTYESLDAAADVLKAAGLDRVLLVTDPYHALRTKLTADEVGLDAHVSPTPTSVVGRWTSARRQVFEAAGVAIGRVIGFGRLSGLTG